MSNWKITVWVGLIVLAGQVNAQEELRRFKLTPVEQMTPAQRQYFEAMMAGPVSSTGSSAVVNGAKNLGAPFNVYLRSPELADILRKLGEQIRFKSSLPTKLNEFAILITARHWGAQYEWFAHHRLALKAGLEPAIASELALGHRPQGMSREESAIYDFSHELHHNHVVTDTTYKAVVDLFGERGAVDLIAVNGYYVFVSMILNVDRTPLPVGVTPPLSALDTDHY